MGRPEWWHARRRARWWRASAVACVLLTIATCVVVALLPGAVRADADLAKRAVEVEARVASVDCGSRCNEVEYTLDGTTYRVVKRSWNRDLFDRFTIYVDPDDPEGFGTRRGGSRSFTIILGLTLLLVAAWLTACSTIGNRPVERDGDVVRLRASLTHHGAMVALGGLLGALVGVFVAIFLSLGAGDIVTAWAAGTALVAGAVHLWRRRGGTTLELRPREVVRVGGLVRAPLRLGPGTTFQELSRRMSRTSGHWLVRVDDGSSKARLLPSAWGTDGAESRQLLLGHLYRYGCDPRDPSMF
ncbi:hypothetical protein L615_004400000310 [Nocardioides sp. J9]|uniref:hypothetical protein n=1 Tax=Nocardioides sp. J9 TaxID=935844 RepID=UPI0011A2FD45|nr:hypothetical protein [Nocardioides sp. J9]TWG96267.1 hypothetical protein L615_004400000310 [Nocardioides sp. J9]